jgi:hypothetical protein
MTDDDKAFLREADEPFVRVFLRDLFELNKPGGPSTVNGALFAAAMLEMVLRGYHGEKITGLIFAYFGSGLSPADRKRYKDALIFSMYDDMRPKPNVRKLAKQLAAENETLSKEKQWAQGATKWMTMDVYIRRLLRDRAKCKE